MSNWNSTFVLDDIFREHPRDVALEMGRELINEWWREKARAPHDYRGRA